MEEVTGEPLYRDRVCGIEIGKAGMVAIDPGAVGQDSAQRRAGTCRFGTTKGGAGAGGLASVLAGARGGCWRRLLERLVRSPICGWYGTT